MMFSPWILLAALLALGVTNAGSFLYGKRVQEGAHALAQQEAVNEAVAEAERTAAEDKKRAVAAATRRAAAQTRTQQIRTQANETISSQPLAASCDWSPDTFRLLNDAIAAANDSTATAGELSDAVRAANAAGKPRR